MSALGAYLGASVSQGLYLLISSISSTQRTVVADRRKSNRLEP